MFLERAVEMKPFIQFTIVFLYASHGERRNRINSKSVQPFCIKSFLSRREFERKIHVCFLSCSNASVSGSNLHISITSIKDPKWVALEVLIISGENTYRNIVGTKTL